MDATLFIQLRDFSQAQAVLQAPLVIPFLSIALIIFLSCADINLLVED